MTWEDKAEKQHAEETAKKSGLTATPPPEPPNPPKPKEVEPPKPGRVVLCLDEAYAAAKEFAGTTEGRGQVISSVLKHIQSAKDIYQDNFKA